MYYLIYYIHSYNLHHLSLKIFFGYLIAVNFLFGGLFAVCSMMLTFFIKNKFSVVLLPFMCLFGVLYLQDNVWFFLSDVYIAPMDFLRGYTIQHTSGTVILIWAVLLLIFTLGTVWGKGAREDVL